LASEVPTSFIVHGPPFDAIAAAAACTVDATVDALAIAHASGDVYVGVTTDWAEGAGTKHPAAVTA
jgi:hypothetical protein